MSVSKNQDIGTTVHSSAGGASAHAVQAKGNDWEHQEPARSLNIFEKLDYRMLMPIFRISPQDVAMQENEMGRIRSRSFSIVPSEDLDEAAAH